MPHHFAAQILQPGKLPQLAPLLQGDQRLPRPVEQPRQAATAVVKGFGLKPVYDISSTDAMSTSVQKNISDAPSAASMASTVRTAS
mgnify:CR=1 FL=1